MQFSHPASTDCHVALLLAMTGMMIKQKCTPKARHCERWYVNNTLKIHKTIFKVDNFVKSKNFNASQKPGLATKNAEDAKIRRDNLLYFKTIVSAIFAVSALKNTFYDFIKSSFYIQAQPVSARQSLTHYNRNQHGNPLVVRFWRNSTPQPALSDNAVLSSCKYRLPRRLASRNDGGEDQAKMHTITFGHCYLEFFHCIVDG